MTGNTNTRNMLNIKPIIHVTNEPMLRPVVGSSMHPCPGNWLAIGRAVVYHAELLTHLVQESKVGTIQTLATTYSFPAR